MVVVEDLVGDAGAVDAADDLYVGAAIGFRKVAGESAVERDGEQDLKEGSWNVVALEFVLVLVATLDGGCEDGVDGEQEEVMVTGGGIRGRGVRRRKSHFHGAEAGGHSLEAVVGEFSFRKRKKRKNEQPGGMSLLLIRTRAW